MPRKSTSVSLDFTIQPKKLLSELLQDQTTLQADEILPEMTKGEEVQLKLSCGNNKFLNENSVFEEEPKGGKAVMSGISVICLKTRQSPLRHCRSH